MCLNIPCTLLQIAAEFLKYSFFVNGGKIVLPRAVKREFSLGITESGLVKRTDNKIRLSELIYKKKQIILSIKPKMTWFLFTLISIVVFVLVLFSTFAVRALL